MTTTIPLVAPTPHPYADDAQANKIVVSFRPGARPTRTISLHPEVFFRHWVKPLAGWLVIGNGPEFQIPTAELMWPTTVIAGVEIVDQTPGDQCWQCLMSRSWHRSIPAVGEHPAHRFDWSPIGEKRRQMGELHPEMFPFQANEAAVDGRIVVGSGTLTTHHVRDEAGDLWGFEVSASGFGWRCTECVHPSHNGGVGDVVHLGNFQTQMPKIPRTITRGEKT